MTKRKFSAAVLACFLVTSFLCACSARFGNGGTADRKEPAAETEEKLTVVGFSQVGAESDWRSANTESMKSVFTAANGYELIFDDAQQKQTNQIMAIRSFIQQEVDYIVLAPVTETGWDTVLQEAHDAGIPVIIVDRMVDVPNSNLFECWVGSDFELEARKMCEWLRWFCVKHNISAEDVYIADIQGTIGASAQIGRTRGLKIAAEEYGWNIVAEVEGEFTRTKGYEATQQLLLRYPKLNVVYCENDNEAFGAIEAIEDAGLRVGSDITAGEIMVLSFDGVKPEALQDVLDDSISCIAECNPLHGPRVEAIIQKLQNGETPQKYEYVDEDVFSAYDQIESVIVDSKEYPITQVSEELIEKRRAEFDAGSYDEELPDNVY
ncbi:MAG: ABC transporter substrate-binding protein [Lachnospiraceae bacterium]|nr:ABC transporter substrate-binding protein [Lachnospiraceae bacterium]